MFQQRQLNEIYSFVEVSFVASMTPGSMTAGAKSVVTVTPVLGSIYGTANNTIALGDKIDVIPANNVTVSYAGILIDAYPTGTGTITVSFYNTTGNIINPPAGQFTFIAKRLSPTVV